MCLAGPISRPRPDRDSWGALAALRDSISDRWRAEVHVEDDAALALVGDFGVVLVFLRSARLEHEDQ